MDSIRGNGPGRFWLFVNRTVSRTPTRSITAPKGSQRQYAGECSSSLGNAPCNRGGKATGLSVASQSVLPTASPGTAGDSKLARPLGSWKRPADASWIVCRTVPQKAVIKGALRLPSLSSFSRLHRCSSASPSFFFAFSFAVHCTVSSASCTESWALAEEAITVFVVFFFLPSVFAHRI